MNITINGTPHVYKGHAITYHEVAKLAGHQPPFTPSVTYSARTPDGATISGIMTPRKSVPVTEGMRFSCCDTSNA